MSKKLLHIFYPIYSFLLLRSEGKIKEADMLGEGWKSLQEFSAKDVWPNHHASFIEDTEMVYEKLKTEYSKT
jgi:hypothetical protein